MDRLLESTYKNAVEYIKNTQVSHPGVSNVYVFTLKDREGNVVDEFYSMNHITNYGFNYLYGADSKNNNWSSGYLYIGNGVAADSDSVYSVTSSQMCQVLYGGLPATNVSTTPAYDYPLYYEAPVGESKGLITVFAKTLTCYYDYTIPQYPGDVVITEYGIGPAYNSSTMTEPWNHLWTHSKIFDKYGTKMSITKDGNLRLDITVYLCLSIYEDVIIDGWNDGIYSSLTSAEILLNHMLASAATYAKDGKLNPITSTSTIDVSELTNNKIKNILTFGNISFAITNVTAQTRYMNGYLLTRNGFQIFQPHQLTNAQSFSAILTGEMDPNEKSFANMIGADSSVPISQMDLSHVYLFDVYDNDWTNEINFYNNPNHLYDDTSLNISTAQPLYVTQNRGTNNERIVTLYLYQNTYTSDPILTIDSNLNQRVLYTTNAYWDETTWEPVTNFNAISQTSAVARYWITDTNEASILPARQSGYFYIKPTGLNNSGFESIQNYKNLGYEGSPIQIDNYQYGYFVRGTELFIPSRHARVDLSVSFLSYMTYGKWLIGFKSGNGKSVYMMDMSNVVNINPTSADITNSEVILNFSASSVDSNKILKSETGTGLICVMDKVGGEAVIIDMNNQNPTNTSTHITIQCSIAHAVWGTNNIVYLSTDRSTINVYDTTTNTITWSIAAPMTYSSTPMIFAHTNYIWITNGSAAYTIRIGSTSVDDYKTISLNTSFYSDDSKLYAYTMTAVDNALIIYRYTDTDFSKGFYIDLRNDGYKSVDNLSALNYGSSRTNMFYKLRYIEGSTLVLLIQSGMSSNTAHGGASITVMDFGRYLFDKTIDRRTVSKLGIPGYIMYGEYVFCNISEKKPLMYMMSVQLNGTTKTIGCVDHETRVTNKQFMITFTNVPTWGTGSTRPNKGIPPGVQE